MIVMMFLCLWGELLVGSKANSQEELFVGSKAKPQNHVAVYALQKAITTPAVSGYQSSLTVKDAIDDAGRQQPCSDHKIQGAIALTY